MAQEQTYKAGDIRVLEGLDAVRKRPGMYIGTTGSKGMHHILWEIIDNCVDEVANGFGDTVTIELLDAQKPAEAKRFKVLFYCVVSWIFGLTFVINLLESGEDTAGKRYAELIEDVPEAKGIMEEEERHERKLAEMVDEERLKYIGSMVLGLNDALVELTGR